MCCRLPNLIDRDWRVCITLVWNVYNSSAWTDLLYCRSFSTDVMWFSECIYIGLG
jgi:hypothetical protein